MSSFTNYQITKKKYLNSKYVIISHVVIFCYVSETADCGII